MKPSRRAGQLTPMELPRLRGLAGAGQLLDIAVGIPHRPPPASVVAAAATALGQGHSQYADPAGLPQLRAAIAADRLRTTGVAVDPATEVTVTCGAAEAMLVALLAVVDPGDEVIVLEPYYESYPGVVRMAGATPRTVRLAGPDWRLDADALRREVTRRTRAVIVNSPHNPTGRVFDAAELRSVLAVCADFDLVCVTDEVYDHYVFGDRRYVSGWSLPDGRARVIITGGLSKTLRITGWRIGYCVAVPEMTSALRRVHERTTIGAATPLQHGAASLGAADTDAGAESLRAGRDLLVERLGEMGFPARVPDGGWFVLAGTRAAGIRASRLCADLARSAGLLLAPGTAFFTDPDDGDEWVRATFVRDPAYLSAALDRMQRHLRAPAPAVAARHVGPA